MPLSVCTIYQNTQRSHHAWYILPGRTDHVNHADLKCINENTATVQSSLFMVSQSNFECFDCISEDFARLDTHSIYVLLDLWLLVTKGL